MTFYIFGNPDLAEDSLPLRILPCLRKRFPESVFEIKDPNEEWDVFEHLYIIDTVVGPKDAAIYDDISVFAKSPTMTLHDFDAHANLLFLKKLGNIKGCTIIGIPPHFSEQEACKRAVTLIHSISP